MKKIAVIILLLIVVFGWSIMGRAGSEPGAAGSDIDLLKRAFTTTAAEAANAEIVGWAVIAEDYYSPREAEAAVIAMAEVFELNRNEYTVHLRSTGYYGYAVMDYDLSDSVSLRLQVQAVNDETIASVELRQGHHRCLEANYLLVKQALERAGAQDAKITSCLEGQLDARLRDSEKLNIAYAAFNAVDAVYQEGMESNGVAVWSGWSPLFEHSLNTGRKDVNFGIALRWDSGSRKTVIKVATPVLPGSY